MTITIRKWIFAAMLFLPMLIGQAIAADNEYKTRNFTNEHYYLKNVDDVFKNTTISFFCATFGAEGCSYFISYSASPEIVKQVRALSREELNQYTQSVGGLMDWLERAVTFTLTEIISYGLFLIVPFLVAVFFLKKSSGKSYAHVTLFTFACNAAATGAVFLIIKLATVSKAVSAITLSWLYIAGIFLNFADQMHMERFDNKRIYLESIKMPDYNNKVLEFQDLNRFGLCVASKGGANIPLVFSQLDNRTLITTAQYQGCTLRMTIGYDSTIQTEATNYQLSIQNINDLQIKKLKEAVDHALDRSAGVVSATAQAYETGSSTQTIMQVGTDQLPQSRKDSYVFFTTIPALQSKSFIQEISGVDPSPYLNGRQAELCGSTDHSGGRPFFRPGAGAAQAKQCVQEACDRSLYTCASALYFERELIELKTYRAKGIAGAGIFLIKGELEINENPRVYSDKFTAKFEFNATSDIDKQSSVEDSVFTSNYSIAANPDFDSSSFMHFTENRKNEFNKLFEDEDYGFESLTKSDNGFLNLDKFNTCSRIENENTYTNGFACSTAMLEMKYVGKSILGFVAQVKLAFLSNKLAMSGLTQYTNPANTITKQLAKKAMVQIVGSVALAKLLDTEISPSMYADFDSNSFIYNNALKAAVMVMAFNEKTQDNILEKIQNVGIPAGLFAYSYPYFLYVIVTYSYVMFLGGVLIFALLSPLMIFWYIKFKENAFSSAFGLIVDKAFSFISYMIGLTIVLTVVPLTVGTYVNAERITNLATGGAGFANTIAGLFYMLFCGVITLFFYIYFGYKAVYEAGRTTQRIENNMTGNLKYDVQSPEEQIIHLTKSMK